MVLGTIISGMETHMQENILQTRCRDLVCIVLQMDIDTKGHGMKAGDKALACTHSEMVRLRQATGKTVLSTS